MRRHISTQITLGIRIFTVVLVASAGLKTYAQQIDTRSLIQQTGNRVSFASYPGGGVGMSSSKDPYARAFQLHSAEDPGNLTQDAPVDDDTQRSTCQNVSGSTYKIQNTGIGLYVGSSGSAAGGLLTLAPYTNACSQDCTATLLQHSSDPLQCGFTVQSADAPYPAADDIYNLVNASSGLLLDVPNAPTAL